MIPRFCLGLGINILVIAGAVMAVMSASKEGKKKLAELQLQKDEEAKRQAEAQAEAKRQARQAEAEAKRQREKRKETLLEEWLDVLGQWKAQDQKGEPRYPSVMALIKTQRERAEKEQDPEVKAWLMETVERLQRQPNWIRPISPIYRQKQEVNPGVQKEQQAKPVSVEDRIRELAEIVSTAFQVKSCPRCYENKMALIEVSPTAASIRYACAHCRKEQRAVAISSDSQKAKYLEKMIAAKLGGTWFRTLGNGYRCTFPTPEATLPYQRRTRERIPEAIAAEVWRRDDGQCVKCESRENLHIDHIIPLSQGGATIVSNLQVLCQSCNLSKGARI